MALKSAEDTFYEVVIKEFPFITREKFKESLEKSNLLSSALTAMKNYAEEALDEASVVAYDNTANSEYIHPDYLSKLIEEIKNNLK